MTVTLHIGTFKTGTSSIQRYLRDHPDLLAEHGVRFPHGWLRRDCHLELHMALMRLDRTSSARMQGTDWLDPAWRASLLDQVAADLAAHPDEQTVLSAEHTGLLRYRDELQALRMLIGRQAHVIVYLRDPAAFLTSMRDQLVKNGIEPSTDPQSHAYVETDSWLADYRDRFHHWRQTFPRTTFLDYDATTRHDGTVIPSFMEQLGIHRDDLPDLDHYWLNARGHTDARIPGNRDHNLPFGAIPVPTPTVG
jgi:hypothetical protein